MASEKPRKSGRARQDDGRGQKSSARHRDDDLRKMVIDAVTEKVGVNLRAKLDAKAAQGHPFAPIARDALDLWTRQPPGARRARFTRDEIARAALRIADDEGFDALSMRRLALALDAGTMTLYHYVRTKDELLALVSDAVMGELILDDAELQGGWRRAMSNLARRSRDTFARHPWIFDVRDDPAIGPNSVRHFDQSIQALAELEIPLRDKLDILSAVDEMVFGYALQMRNNYEGSIEDDAQMAEYVVALASTGEYAHLDKLLAEHGSGVWKLVAETFRDPDRFERTLRRLLDGIEHDLAR